MISKNRQTDLANIPDEELSPEVLSSKHSYLFFATLYSLTHLGICAFLFLVSPEYYPSLHKFLIWVLIVSPFLIFFDLYYRQIWVPYRTEMQRRSNVPPSKLGKHPYKFGRIAVGLSILSITNATLAAMVFLWGDELSGSRAYTRVVFGLIILPPAEYISLYHSFFIWKGTYK
jgi:hypothetical protein